MNGESTGGLNMLASLKDGVVLAKRKAEKKGTQIDNDAISQRIKHYTNCMLTKDVEGLFSALLEDMDKDKILNEVKKQQKRYPDLSPQELSIKEIDTIAKTMSGVAIGSGLAWVVPGVAIFTGPLATAGELIGLFVFQSRLVVKVAAYFGLDISVKERARDVAVCVASSSLGKGTSLAAAAAVKKFGPKLAKIAAQKMSQTAIKGIPGIGSLAGLVGGAVGAVSNYYAIKGTGVYALKMYGGDNLLSYDEDDSFDKTIIFVAMLIAQADGIITDDEKNVIKTLVDGSKLKEGSKKEIITKISSQLSISDIQGKLSEKEKKVLIITGIKISMADRKIDKSELDIIFELASSLSVDKTYVNQIIEKYKEALSSDFSEGNENREFLLQEEAKNNMFVLHT